jgi:hypothetical protein
MTVCLSRAHTSTAFMVTGTYLHLVEQCHPSHHLLELCLVDVEAR